jgi:hypothetical protein
MICATCGDEIVDLETGDGYVSWHHALGTGKHDHPAKKKLPTAADLFGSDPDFTGDETTDEYIGRIRGRAS